MGVDDSDHVGIDDQGGAGEDEHSRPASVEKLSRWQIEDRWRNANIGISYCTTVVRDGTEYQLISLDVDHYRRGDTDNGGGDQLDALVTRLGPMSDRQPWISSARRDGISGIRWHLAPIDDDGRRIEFSGKADRDIDVIQRKHRYAVVWPSIHPEGGTYQWFPPRVAPDDDGTAWNDDDELPNPADFPVLSPSWVAHLSADLRNDTSGLQLDWAINNSDLLAWAKTAFNDGQGEDLLERRQRGT